MHRVNRREIPQVAGRRYLRANNEPRLNGRRKPEPIRAAVQSTILAESYKCSLYIGEKSNRSKKPESSPENDKNVCKKCV